MFTVYHFIWLAVCAVILVAGFRLLMTRRPPLRDLLTLCCIGAAASEIIKVFCTIQLVPSADGSTLLPYLELKQLPFHICALQIFFIYYARFAKDSKFREALLAFMYPAGMIGAAIALCVPTVFTEVIPATRAFTHPMGYQYFLYHTMLILMGGYIAFSGQVDIKPKHYLTSVGFLSVFAFFSLYINSMFSIPVYEDGVLTSVQYGVNFLFTYRPPIDIAFTQPWHWFFYLGIIAALALGLIALCYIPVFRKNRK